MTLDITIHDKKYSAKEWKDKESNGKKAHRLYVMGPDGEIGHFDLKEGVFNNSKKTAENFSIVDEEPLIEIKNKKGNSISLGLSVENRELKNNDALERLHDATTRFGKLESKTTKVEINVGPTVELKIHGRSHWAKANLTIAVEDVDDVEELYTIVSDMANAMLDVEIEKLSKR